MFSFQQHYTQFKTTIAIILETSRLDTLKYNYAVDFIYKKNQN